MTRYTVFQINGVAVALLTTNNTLFVLYDYMYEEKLEELIEDYPTEYVDSLSIPV